MIYNDAAPTPTPSASFRYNVDVSSGSRTSITNHNAQGGTQQVDVRYACAGAPHTLTTIGPPLWIAHRREEGVVPSRRRRSVASRWLFRLGPSSQLIQP